MNCQPCTTIDRILSQPDTTIKRILSFLSIDDGYTLLLAYHISPDLIKWHISPVRHFSKFLNYAHSFVVAMADKGCVVSGSDTLEFFVPGSIDKNSDLDIYIPGNLQSVTNILTVLEKCGVKWNWLGDDLDRFISGTIGTTIEIRIRQLDNIYEWRHYYYQNATEQTCKCMALAQYLFHVQ